MTFRLLGSSFWNCFLKSVRLILRRSYRCTRQLLDEIARSFRLLGANRPNLFPKSVCLRLLKFYSCSALLFPAKTNSFRLLGAKFINSFLKSVRLILLRSYSWNCVLTAPISASIGRRLELPVTKGLRRATANICRLLGAKFINSYLKSVRLILLKSCRQSSLPSREQAINFRSLGV